MSPSTHPAGSAAGRREKARRAGWRGCGRGGRCPRCDVGASGSSPPAPAALSAFRQDNRYLLPPAFPISAEMRVHRENRSRRVNLSEPDETCVGQGHWKVFVFPNQLFESNPFVEHREIHFQKPRVQKLEKPPHGTGKPSQQETSLRQNRLACQKRCIQFIEFRNRPVMVLIALHEVRHQRPGIYDDRWFAHSPKPSRYFGFTDKSTGAPFTHPRKCFTKLPAFTPPRPSAAFNFASSASRSTADFEHRSFSANASRRTASESGIWQVSVVMGIKYPRLPEMARQAKRTSPHQPPPVAAERGAEPVERGDEDGDAASLDLLHGARIESGTARPSPVCSMRNSGISRISQGHHSPSV